MAESEMVERVARAIMAECQNMGALAHRVSGNQAIERRIARAAIEAMREPTDAMVDAAYGRERTGTERGNWRAMIDAALTDTQAGSSEIAVQRQPEKQDG